MYQVLGKEVLDVGFCKDQITNWDNCNAHMFRVSRLNKKQKSYIKVKYLFKKKGLPFAQNIHNYDVEMFAEDRVQRRQKKKNPEKCLVVLYMAALDTFKFKILSSVLSWVSGGRVLWWKYRFGIWWPVVSFAGRQYRNGPQLDSLLCKTNQKSNVKGSLTTALRYVNKRVYYKTIQHL